MSVYGNSQGGARRASDAETAARTDHTGDTAPGPDRRAAADDRNPGLVCRPADYAGVAASGTGSVVSVPFTRRGMPRGFASRNGAGSSGSGTFW